jgi:hypothetical protein
MKEEKPHPGTDQAFDRLHKFIRGIVAVPKKEVEAAEKRYREERPSKKKRSKS